MILILPEEYSDDLGVSFRRRDMKCSPAVRCLNIWICTIVLEQHPHDLDVSFPRHDVQCSPSVYGLEIGICTIVLK
jgi:hypothetical protein